MLGVPCVSSVHESTAIVLGSRLHMVNPPDASTAMLYLATLEWERKPAASETLNISEVV